MHGVNASLYLRAPIEIEDALTISGLSLRVGYEDWLRRVPERRRGRAAQRASGPGLESPAASDRPREAILIPESIDLAPHLDLVLEGTNVLSVHALNDRPDSSDFLIDPTLEVTRSRRLVYFTEPTPRTGQSDGRGRLRRRHEVLRRPRFLRSAAERRDHVRDAGATVRYTTDGSEPTGTHGVVYTGPVLIEDTDDAQGAGIQDRPRAHRTSTPQTYLFLEHGAASGRSRISHDLERHAGRLRDGPGCRRRSPLPRHARGRPQVDPHGLGGDEHGRSVRTGRRLLQPDAAGADVGESLLGRAPGARRRARVPGRRRTEGTRRKQSPTGHHTAALPAAPLQGRVRRGEARLPALRGLGRRDVRQPRSRRETRATTGRAPTRRPAPPRSSSATSGRATCTAEWDTSAFRGSTFTSI